MTDVSRRRNTKPERCSAMKIAFFLWLVGLASGWAVACGIRGQLQSIPLSVVCIPTLIGGGWLLETVNQRLFTGSISD